MYCLQELRRCLQQGDQTRLLPPPVRFVPTVCHQQKRHCCCLATALQIAAALAVTALRQVQARRCSIRASQWVSLLAPAVAEEATPHPQRDCHSLPLLEPLTTTASTTAGPQPVQGCRWKQLRLETSCAACRSAAIGGRRQRWMLAMPYCLMPVTRRAWCLATLLPQEMSACCLYCP